MPLRLIEDATSGELAFLVSVEVESARHAPGIMSLGAQDQDSHQDEGAHGENYSDNPFHGGLIAGGIAGCHVKSPTDAEGNQRRPRRCSQRHV